MANQLYPKFKEALLRNQIDLPNDDLRVAIVDTAGGAQNYAYSANHEFLSSVPTDSIRGISPLLSGKTFGNGVFDAANIALAFPDLSGAAIEAMILYQDTGVTSTSRLIAYWDIGGSLPFAPSGNGADLVFDAQGLFSL